MSSQEPFNSKYALSDRQMLDFCRQKGIDANIVTLKEYNEDPGKANVRFIIYTGNEPNEYNTLSEKEKEMEGGKFTFGVQPITHHWMGGIGNMVFDSYGYYGDYKWPSETEGIETIPTRLQEFNSDVCGLYVLAFLDFTIKETDYSNLGIDFVNHYGFSTNRNKNDETVITWYEKEKNEK
jgi:hypothetical protein